MKRNLRQSLWIIIFVLCFSSSDLTVSQTQNSTSTPSEIKRSDNTHRVQIQLLVASNIAHAKTDYPASLESVVKQLKSSLRFKNHYLVATYLYSVADSSAFEVSDVTYAEFEKGSGLSPTFFNFGISGIKKADSDSLHISKLRFEARKRIFIENQRGEGNTVKPMFETVGTGITTALNVEAGIPAMVGTTTSALSDGVLVLVITVDPSGI